MNHTLHFVIEKETKGTIKYKEVNEDGSDVFDAKVGTLYVRKSAMGGKMVQKLKVSITGE